MDFIVLQVFTELVCGVQLVHSHLFRDMREGVMALTRKSKIEELCQHCCLNTCFTRYWIQCGTFFPLEFSVKETRSINSTFYLWLCFFWSIFRYKNSLQCTRKMFKYLKISSFKLSHAHTHTYMHTHIQIKYKRHTEHDINQYPPVTPWLDIYHHIPIITHKY